MHPILGEARGNSAEANGRTLKRSANAGHPDPVIIFNTSCEVVYFHLFADFLKT
jgi:hypothetical protein